jgi:hypothetical protein
MTAEEHVATAETHLRYAEGHLQPTEEHMADAEVHLKLVKAHLVVLAAIEPPETGPCKTETLPPTEPASGKAGTDRTNGAPEGGRDLTPRSRAGPAEQGSGSDDGVPPPGAGEQWACPIRECQDSTTMLECVRSRSERGSARALQPDVIVGWPDWNKVQPFVMSGWAASGQTPLGATAPATRWHLRMNQKGCPPMYLNVELDPMRQRSTILHEAAVRIGRRYETSYMLFARAEDGEVRNLVAIGADAMVRADKRRPADRASKGPDLLLNAEDASGMAKCLKPGWKGEEELGGRGGCPVEGQWHGKLKGRQVLRDPGWTCMLFVKTGGANQDIFIRVMFNTIREQSVVLHSVAVKLGLRASGGPMWLTHPGEDPRYSSCVYEVPVLDWKGRRDWIKARVTSYVTPLGHRDMPEGAMEAFPEISLSGVTVGQAAGPADMIIGRDNLEWMPVPVQEEPYERFTLM